MSHLTHAYGEHPVLNGVELALHPGEFVALIGGAERIGQDDLAQMPGRASPRAAGRQRAHRRQSTWPADPLAAHVAARFRGRSGAGYAAAVDRRQCLGASLAVRGGGLPSPSPESSLRAMGSRARRSTPWLDNEVQSYSLGHAAGSSAFCWASSANSPLLVLDEPMNAASIRKRVLR